MQKTLELNFTEEEINKAMAVRLGFSSKTYDGGYCQTCIVADKISKVLGQNVDVNKISDHNKYSVTVIKSGLETPLNDALSDAAMKYDKKITPEPFTTTFTMYV